jgi:hypothetical protein
VSEYVVESEPSKPNTRGRGTGRVSLTIPSVVLEEAHCAARERGLSLSAFVVMTLTRPRLPDR